MEALRWSNKALEKTFDDNHPWRGYLKQARDIAVSATVTQYAKVDRDKAKRILRAQHMPGLANMLEQKEQFEQASERGSAAS